ncbi:MAG: ATP-binding cassette domain-containing protein, partial [Burkholderiales bacterium]|nr:ATP-binding cassette domain-containing protein [Burkholderiales bacterium]
GIVGESGSGKSTLARLVMALEAPTAGRVQLLGRDLNALAPAALRAARCDFQMVFQDPYGSLDPRQRIGRIVAEPLVNVPARDARARVAASLDAVGLRATDADKYPHEFSGGQRQRIAIARALITRPKLIVADEPVSALDVSVQAQVLNLLADLQQQFGLTYLFISHDLAVVDHLCDEVAVMYAGRIVEQGTPQQLFRAAAHPYTRALMRALPQAEVDRGAPGPAGEPWFSGAESNPGSARVAADEPIATLPTADSAHACAYAPRCPYRQPRCEIERPALRLLASGQLAACHLAESVPNPAQGEP